jgi:SM-20-related protein
MSLEEKKERLILELLNQGYGVIDDFLEPKLYSELKNLASHLLSEEAFQEASIGRHDKHQKQQTIRNDKTFWLHQDSEYPPIQAYLKTLDSLKEALNQAFFLGLNAFESHMAVYPPGSFYKKHVDQFEKSRERQISCVYYLNDHWCASDGGALVLYEPKDNVLAQIYPHANRFACFRSDMPHEVQLTHAQRLSIAGWFKIRALNSPLI